jgi:small GTP-binding protein
MGDSDDSLTYKVIALGASGVGKTSIVQRYSSGVFQQPNQTIGAGYRRCTVNLATGPITLNVWDTAGQEKFHSLIPLYLRGADAAVIVFDVMAPRPAESLDKLYTQIRQHLDASVFLLLCGNKCDLLADEMEPEGVVAWAAAREIGYFKTSAMTGQGIDQLFFAIAGGVHEVKERVSVSVRAAEGAAESEQATCC